MRITKTFAVAMIVAAPTLVSLSPAQAASECPATGTLSDWGVNLDGLLQRRFRSNLPVPYQDAGGSEEFKRFTKTRTRDVEKAQRIDLRIYGEGRI